MGVTKKILVNIAATLKLIHCENIALMRMLSYPKQESKIKEYERAYDEIWKEVTDARV